MTLTFPINLNGANCTLGGQTIISWNATEDNDSDYDTASAVCLAPGGAHAKGDDVESIEGGVSTGHWTIEDSVAMRSSDTWKKAGGGSSFEHIPLVSYICRRRGYVSARSTISRGSIPAVFPPKFCTLSYFSAFTMAVAKKLWSGELTASQAYALTGSLIPVSSPDEIVRILCDWAGLSCSFQSGLYFMPDTWEPISKPYMTAIKEVAGWSGASVHLNREGVVVIYSWSSVYASGEIPRPVVVMSEEIHDSLYSITACTVVGTGKTSGGLGSWVQPKDAEGKPDLSQQAVWEPWDPTNNASADGGVTRAIERTSSWSAFSGDQIVEERIEISDYPITEELADALAGERMGRVVLAAGRVRLEGPGEGSQAIAPVTHRVFSVTRSLQWTGNRYDYRITIEAPGSDIVSTIAPDPILDLGPVDPRRPFA